MRCLFSLCLKISCERDLPLPLAIYSTAKSSWPSVISSWCPDEISLKSTLYKLSAWISCPNSLAHWYYRQPLVLHRQQLLLLPGKSWRYLRKKKGWHPELFISILCRFCYYSILFHMQSSPPTIQNRLCPFWATCRRVPEAAYLSKNHRICGRDRTWSERFVFRDSDWIQCIVLIWK